MNANSKNCVDLLPDPTEPSPQPSPLFDYSCSLPDQAYANMCVQFSVLECCFANQLTVLEQTLNQMYAPCVMNRLSQCPIPVFTDTFCSEGTLRGRFLQNQFYHTLRLLYIVHSSNKLYAVMNIYQIL